MEGKIAWLVVLSFFMLAQSLYMALKIIKEKNEKKKGETENPSHGERIAKLEEGIENLEKRMDRLEDKINKAGKK